MATEPAPPETTTNLPEFGALPDGIENYTLDALEALQGEIIAKFGEMDDIDSPAANALRQTAREQLERINPLIADVKQPVKIDDLIPATEAVVEPVTEPAEPAAVTEPTTEPVAPATEPVATEDLPQVPEGTEIPDSPEGLTAEEIELLRASLAQQAGAASAQAMAATSTVPASAATNVTPATGAPIRRATLEGVHDSWAKGDMNDPVARANAFVAACKGSGTNILMRAQLWDKNDPVVDATILKAGLTNQEVSERLGMVDSSGSFINRAGLRDDAVIHRAALETSTSCGCSKCGTVLQAPDCFTEEESPFAGCFPARPMDGCKIAVVKPQALTEADDPFCVEYCDAETGGMVIVDAEGVRTPIDPTKPETWKPVIDLEVDCDESDYDEYGLKEVGIAVTIPRNLDKCDPEAVNRKLNKYYARLDRVCDLARKNQVFDFVTAQGLYGEANAVNATASIDIKAALADFLTILQDHTGVTPTFDKVLSPVGFQKWGDARRVGSAPTIAEAFADCDITGITETSCLTPYVNGYTVAPDTAIAPANPLGALVEYTFELMLVDTSQWDRRVGDGIELGVGTEYRDFNLALANRRGVFLTKDEVMIPNGCLPAAKMTFSLCNSGLIPGVVSVGC